MHVMMVTPINELDDSSVKSIQSDIYVYISKSVFVRFKKVKKREQVKTRWELLVALSPSENDNKVSTAGYSCFCCCS